MFAPTAYAPSRRARPGAPSLPSAARATPRALLGLALAGLLAACASPLPVRTAPPPVPQRQPEVAAFSARLSGASAVPASDSAASGELVAVLQRDTGVLQWKLQFSGLSGPVTGAHFHSPGMDGEVAPAVLPLGRSVSSPVEGRAALTPRQRADLLAGQWYVNLRTARHPEGELRGQLIERH